ncbi:LuxR family transcriptional regulator [Streptomyces sp. RKAG293]|uniref:ATP-binding protein n=1 Tax=Streptomyces sp. RKAG293 TaxID=2893403 RepID=UPI0020332694|nr:LuxR family transcriptional regulator [Streptomyces sp. RKAG293]MCM2422656.1 AAA family ATPase [Streptomyces sp. RKAG293]
MPIGRERELDAVKALLGAQASSGKSVLVHGDAGSGKSALLRAAVEEIREEGDTILPASGDAMESRFAFGVVRQLFGRIVRAAGDGPDSPLSGHASVAATLLVGPAPGQYIGAPPVSGHDEELLHGLYWLAVNLTANGRLLLVIDDLQWADTHSLRWLHFLLRRADNLPLVLLASLTPEPVSDDADTTGAVARLFRRRLALQPLDEDAVASAVEHALGAGMNTSFLTACRAATGGNLFLLNALLRTLHASGPPFEDRAAAELTHLMPPGVRRAVHGLIKNCGPDSLAVAHALVVLDGSADVALLAGVAELVEGRALDAVHGLVRAGLMTRTDETVVFASPLAAAAFAKEIVPSRRQQLHARAALLQLAQDAPLEVTAAHFRQAPLGVPGAAEVLYAAASQARQKSRPEDAIALFQRAVREGPDDDHRATSLIGLGRAELTTSLPDAVRHLQRGLKLSRDTTEQTAAARALSRALCTLDRYAEALAVLRDTSAALCTVNPVDALRLEVDFLYGGVCLPGSAASVMPRLHELRLSDAHDSSAKRPLAALLSLRAVMIGEDPQDVVSLARSAWDQGLCPDEESTVYLGAIIALGATGQAELGLSYANTAVHEARRRGSALAYAYAVSARAAMRIRLGQVQECRADAQAALEALGEIGVGRDSARSVAAAGALLDSLTKQGELDEASVLAQGRLAGDLDGHWINDHVLLSRGRLRMAQGRTREALADFLLCGHRAGARGLTGAGVLAWRSEAALAHAELDEPEPALALAQEELSLARHWGVPEFEGIALRALGLVTGGAEGLAMLHSAVEILEGTTARYNYAQATADYGAQARATGDLAQARPHLQLAVSVAHQIGATVVAEAALAELRAMGDRPRTHSFRGVDALTPTERRVTDLAAQGMTNRAIAGHLFVGLRTVEEHLTNAYRKLDIDGRPELAEALARPV